MNSSTEEKKLLIQSMKKLVTHVSNNPQRQKEIFEALSLQDLNKIILNLRDDNQYLRRISALLLCELFYQNAETKLAAAKLLGIQPCYGRICLSGIPESIHKYPSTLKKCLELMQTPALPEEEEDRICWIINLQRKTLKLELLQYKKYSSFTFIDPLKNIFGFASFLPNQQFPRKEGKEMQVSVERAKDVEGRTQPSSLTQSTHLNSQFYKNYLESRNRSKDSKRDSFSSNYANLSVDLGEGTRPGYTRPITSRPSVNYTTTRQEPNSSFQSRPNPIHNISQYARNGYNNSKMTRSTYQPPLREGQETLTQRRGQEALTERKTEQGQTRVRTSGQTSPMGATHERFYKRVKDILKK